MDYRRDIDGLRAVAVVPVILFHARLPVFPGGFVGVDVFFVISGYLITTLLLQSIDAGQYSILDFYDRRARRILPALFTVMAATALLAFPIMLPTQIEEFSKSLAAVTLFLSNFYFMSQVGYFSPDAELQPLLHTWSLAVEEQFYLLFPPLLALLCRGRRQRVMPVLLVLALISLALSIWGATENPARNFFFTFSRMWELLAGSMAALALHRKDIPGNGLAAAAGLGLILVSLVWFDAAVLFPSAWTIVPVIGTVLVIVFSRPGSFVGGVLGLRPLVGVGLISYSAYLWHQPLFALARLYCVAEPSIVVMLGLAATSLGLAWATWAWIEQPFRRKRLPILSGRARLFGAVILVSGVFLTLGVTGNQTNGFSELWRKTFPQSAAIIDVIETAKTEAIPQDDGACKFNVETVDKDVANRLHDCAERYGPGVAVLGDSHAIDLFGIISARGDRPFVAGFTKPSCRPDVTDRECPYDSFRAFVAAHPDAFQVVIFEMSGAYLLTDEGGARGVQSTIERLPLGHAAPRLLLAHTEIELVSAALADFGKLLPIVWLGPRVEPQVQLEWLVGRGCDAGLVIRAGTEENFRRLDDALVQVAKDVPYLSQIALFGMQFPRDLGGCNGLLWSDGDHYSAKGEVEMGRRVDVVAAALHLLAGR